jgi:hypothetical protein
MSKPKHVFRGKGRYIGHGYSTTDFAKRPAKGEFSYQHNIAEECKQFFKPWAWLSDKFRHSATKAKDRHLTKLHKYSGRARGLK